MLSGEESPSPRPNSAVPSTVGVYRGLPLNVSRIRNQMAMIAAPIMPAIIPSKESLELSEVELTVTNVPVLSV